MGFGYVLFPDFSGLEAFDNDVAKYYFWPDSVTKYYFFGQIASGLVEPFTLGCDLLRYACAL